MSIVRTGTRPAFEVGPARFQPLTDPARDGGELAVWRLDLPPGPPGVPHVIDREEVFVCTSGTLSLRLDGETEELQAGDATAAPAGTLVAAGAGARGATAIVSCRMGLTVTMDDGSQLRPPWAQAAPAPAAPAPAAP